MMKRVKKAMLTTSAVGVFCCIATGTAGALASSNSTPKSEEIRASQIVRSYQSLRSECSKSEAASDRKACFGKLKDSHEKYVSAKRYLKNSQGVQDDRQNVHMVTFL